MIDGLTALGLPLGGFALLFVALLHAAPDSHPFRRTFISAALGLGVAVFGITEALSALGAVNHGGVLIGWLIVDLGLLALNARLGRPRVSLDGVRESLSSGPVRGLLVGGAVVAAITLLIALVAPPNNNDSMTYHMARVAHWVESGNVNFYATSYTAQLYQAPWGSYVMLHLLLLDRGDQLVNMGQWLSLVGCALVGSLVAAQLGAGRIGQALAGLVVLTLPMAILQASSAQDHLLVSFWLVCLASLVLTSRDGISWRLTVEVGVCLGLAIITKVTTYVFAPPLILLAAFWLVRRTKWRAVPRIALAGLLALGLGSLQWARNAAVFGWPFGPRGETATYSMSSFSPATFVERAIQDVSLQLVVPTHALNGRLTDALTSFAGLLHLDLNDPATTYLGMTWHVPYFNTHEDTSANLLAFALVVVVAAVVVLRKRGVHLVYLVAVVAAYALFVGYVRWQPWNARLHLPLLILAAPLVGAVVGEWRRTLVLALAGLLLAGSLPWLVDASERPLLGPGSVLTASRTDLYFVNRPDLEDPYVKTAAAIADSGCRDVGVAVQVDEHYEYPLWRLLNPSDPLVVVRDVEVMNETAKLETGPPPCMIVFVQAGFGTPQTYRGIQYRQVLEAGLMHLYQRNRAQY